MTGVVASGLRRAFRLFWREQKGISALEFALLLPCTLLMVFGSIELGLLVMTDAAVEMAVRSASRFGITYNETGQSRSQQITQFVNDSLAMWVGQGGSLEVSEKVYSSYANVGQPEPFTDLNNNNRWDPGEPFTDVNQNGVWDADQGLSSDGGSGDIVVYQITLKRPGYTGILRMIGLTDFTFLRTILVQNE